MQCSGTPMNTAALEAAAVPDTQVADKLVSVQTERSSELKYQSR